MAILDIRGTNGSGKSWIIHQLLDQFGSKWIIDDEDTHIGMYMPGLDAGVVGPYKPTAPTGGADRVKTPDEICRRITMINDLCRHTLVEGITVAHTFQRYYDLAQKLGDYWFFFLDTPIETCISRVEARRKERGNLKPYDPKNTIADDHRTKVAWRKLREHKYPKIVTLDHTNPFTQLMEVLNA